jgi:hypothetical protein
MFGGLLEFDVSMLPCSTYFFVRESAQAIFEVAYEACGLYAEDEGRIACGEKTVAKVV